MREQRSIKFRAWDGANMIDNCTPVFQENGAVWLIGQPGYNQTGEVSLGISIDTEMWIGDYKVMQYTGLKDKNGVEIYEGDIVKCHIFVQELGENYGVIEGEREFVGRASLDVTGFNIEANGFRDNPVFYDEFHEESLEVIGNIYSNPELLEVRS